MYLYKVLLNKDRLPYIKKENVKICDSYNTTFNKPNIIANAFCDRFNIHNLPEEHIYMLCLDAKLQALAVFEISHGCKTGSLFDIRSIFQKVLLTGATSFVIVHNHVSTDVSPSNNDIDVYFELTEKAQLLDLTLNDSIIIGGKDNYYSFKDHYNEIMSK
jgi:DNA repair protein RadC